jgi:hypothetical protein
MMILGHFLKFFSLNSILNETKTSLFGVFINGLEGCEKYEFVLSQLSSLTLVVIFYSFIVLGDNFINFKWFL